MNQFLKVLLISLLCVRLIFGQLNNAQSAFYEGSAVFEAVAGNRFELDNDYYSDFESTDSGTSKTAFDLYLAENSSDKKRFYNASELAEKEASKTLVDSRTAFIVHGYLQSSEDEDLLELKDALISAEGLSVFMVDWEGGANQPYPESAYNVRVIGRDIALFIDGLVELGIMKLENFHCIGFSLGAHVCGFAGKTLKNSYGLTAPRISGLDPFFPLFLDEPPEERLDKDDAQYVDVIHTSMLGLQNQLGHVDFYPNGGLRQPGCSAFDFLCSHYRAVPLFMASLDKNCTFTSSPAEGSPPASPLGISGPRHQANEECRAQCGRMGYYSIFAEGRGKQILKTTATDPYCLN